MGFDGAGPERPNAPSWRGIATMIIIVVVVMVVIAWAFLVAAPGSPATP